ncbi:GroES-like protein [Jimgerdemannia flammicorona]|uniref:GroES-like protein n=1 Tax=Jimgerdemannia flammicorona TaxID=994334 RepID=A0A433QQV2_9FUNG|nr:GroES-like protein [Jimgerdemannia flammicorona]
MVKALIAHKAGGELQIGEWEKPVPKGNEILVKNKVVALNPVDWKQVREGFGSLGFVLIKYNFAVPQWPFVVGADTAGVVEAVGPDVKNLKPGDKVFAFAGVGSLNYGTYAEYSLLVENLSAKEASTIGLGTLTSAVAFYHLLKLPRPREHQSFFRPEYLLIWGGSSSTGNYAIQLAKLSGYTVITTASPHQHAYLQELGADVVIDRSDPEAVTKIREITRGRLRYAYDTISSATADLAAQALDQEHESHLAVIAGAPTGSYPKVKEANSFGVSFYEELGELLAAGVLRPNRYEVLPNGLAGIPEGHARLAAGKVSGVKLVARIDETP